MVLLELVLFKFSMIWEMSSGVIGIVFPSLSEFSSAVLLSAGSVAFSFIAGSVFSLSNSLKIASTSARISSLLMVSGISSPFSLRVLRFSSILVNTFAISSASCS